MNSPRKAPRAVGGVLVVAAFAACSASGDGTPVELPGGSPGIGFDDLRYAPKLHRLLVPGGRSGRLDLVHPDTLEVTSIEGFAPTSDFSGGHDDGPTSADEGRGFVFVTDRTSGLLSVVDPVAKKIVASTPLGSGPDYVRYVEATDELWVTEPSASRIEIFGLKPSGEPSSVATIPIDNGPESIIVDQTRGLAYTHRWQSSSVVIDVRTRKVVAEWPNGCASSRGLAIDEARQFFIAGCSEGTVSVLDAAHGGRILSSISRGAGFDVLGYDPSRGHVVLAGFACRCFVMLGVDARGELRFLDRQDAPSGTHCATSDDRGHAWVCDPNGGRVLRIDDTQPSSL